MITQSKRGWLLLVAVIITMIIVPFSNEAFAHKVNMFAYAEGSDIFVEGYFSDGKKSRNSTIFVYDSKDVELLRGVTDDNGQFLFPIPKMTDLRLVLNAGMGHQTEYRLSVSELSGEEDPIEGNDVSDVDAANESGQNTTAEKRDVVNNKQLKQVVERAVGKAIKPLMRSVSEMRKEKSFGDIIGGIGFIFGIMGIFFYYKARKESGNK